ncbi:hypothetical protein GCM10018790_58970 [Kitasatospora xanthocidica]|uniref:hypothetical protein n=1 Tax=Kitasatospora xanthocidica TaxID=83382 RepID=UPI001672DD06|nr:hypothetical protein [Kitasatospora xanthocidica]GHF73419.1 hypothetical protein GCM10018790_58970 [Kitasatospora xanthocidica]
MIFVLIVITTVVAAWSLVAGRLETWHVRAPLVLVLAGVLTGVFTHSHLAATINSEVAQHVAEVILAVLLFVDATELPGGRLFGNDPASVARVLLVAMPLSLLAMVLLGALGPRGTTSIVFGLLAFNGLPDGLYAVLALDTMTLTVAGSVVLHGAGWVAIARLLHGPAPAAEAGGAAGAGAEAAPAAGREDGKGAG